MNLDISPPLCFGEVENFFGVCCFKIFYLWEFGLPSFDFYASYSFQNFLNVFFSDNLDLDHDLGQNDLDHDHLYGLYTKI